MDDGDEILHPFGEAIPRGRPWGKKENGLSGPLSFVEEDAGWKPALRRSQALPKIVWPVDLSSSQACLRRSQTPCSPFLM